MSIYPLLTKPEYDSLQEIEQELIQKEVQFCIEHNRYIKILLSTENSVLPVLYSISSMAKDVWYSLMYVSSYIDPKGYGFLCKDDYSAIQKRSLSQSKSILSKIANMPDVTSITVTVWGRDKHGEFMLDLCTTKDITEIKGNPFTFNLDIIYNFLIKYQNKLMNFKVNNG